MVYYARVTSAWNRMSLHRDSGHGRHSLSNGALMDKSIFGLRFAANEAFHPGPQELGDFLERPLKEGGRERHADGVETYARMLQAVADFERDRRQGVAQHGISERMLYGVLSHSRCFTPALKSAVELSLYYTHALASIDLRKPSSFIRSAEEEIGRLNPKRQEDMARIARLRDMTDERKKDLDGLKARWLALARELSGIAVYVRDNLVAVQKLCETSITILVGLQVGRKEEARIIEDIKAHFRDQVRDSLQLGAVTKEYIEQLKETVARLSKQMSLLLLEDSYSLTGLYEALHGHARDFSGKLDGLIAEAGRSKHENIEEDKELYGRIAQTLTALVSTCRLEVKAADASHRDGSQESILIEKRKEMLDHLFSLLQKGQG